MIGLRKQGLLVLQEAELGALGPGEQFEQPVETDPQAASRRRQGEQMVAAGDGQRGEAG